MQNKLNILLLYAFFGVYLALWPHWIAGKGLTLPHAMFGKAIINIGLFKTIALTVAATIALIIAYHSVGFLYMVSFVIIALATSLSKGKLNISALFSSILALYISVNTLWWYQLGEDTPNIFYVKLIIFFIITFTLINFFITRLPIQSNKFPTGWVLVYTIFAAVLSFNSSLIHSPPSSLWHHWSVYVSTSELLLSGAAIFYDFPAQYGLGPTVLIASVCTNDCWEWVYVLVASLNLVYAVIIAALGLSLYGNRPLERGVVIALCLSVSFAWAANPSAVSNSLSWPSVGGMRFLPAVLLVSFLFFANKVEYSKSKTFAAHSLWALGVLWSPESAFYSTFVWWPYYLLISRTQGVEVRAKVMGFVIGVLRLLVIAAGLIITFNIIYRVIYHHGPSLYGYLAYALAPPGEMSINFQGGIWYFLLAIAISWFTLHKSWQKTGDSLYFRRGFLVLLLSYSVFSYFLGRSHDNNLLNILPFTLLVLLHAISAVGSSNLKRAGIVLIATLMGWLPFLNWATVSKAVHLDKPITFEHSIMGGPTVDNSDARNAISFLQEHFGEPITLLDENYRLLRSTPPSVWTALHGTSNVYFLPAERRQEFIRRTAVSIGKPGWMVVEKKMLTSPYLSELDSAYNRTNTLKFGTYYGIRFSPKSSNQIN